MTTPAIIAAEPEEIVATVAVLFCRKPEFCAGKLWYKGREVKFRVKGYVRVNEPVTLKGTWVDDPKWGRQFAATEVVYKVPADPAGIVRWLTWHVDDVGPVKAQQLVDEFGADLMRLACEDPGQVAALGRIPVECVRRFAEKWSRFANRITAAAQLAGWGLSQARTEALIERLGPSAPQVVQDDPYALFGLVDGMGWKQTDALAAQLGVTGDDPRRLRGALAAAVREWSQKGSTAVPRDAACAAAADLVGSDAAGAVAATVEGAVAAGRLQAVGDALASPWAYRCERAVWDVLRTARDANPHPAAVTDALVTGHRLDDGQRAALDLALAHRVVAVTGGAGSGKTTTVRAVVAAFDAADVTVMLAAPTGKAARRLEEVVGRSALTIHRLLEYGPGGFVRTADYPLPPGVVVVDEASMLDAELAYHLFTALGPETTLVLVGDPNQLPPVGPGAVLRDALAHDLVPAARLTGCHRQAGTLKRNCTAVLEGRVEPWASGEPDPCPWVVSRTQDTPEKVVRTVAGLYEKRLAAWGFDPLADAQFMTARHSGPLGTRRLNLVLQRLRQRTLGVEMPEPGADDHEGRPVVRVGDKVIHVENNYTLDVMNGAVGVVVQTGPLVVRYDGRAVEYPKKDEPQVELGYCLTPHKMQGSEVSCAVVVVPKQHAFMQHRHWLYTATTRAKTTCVIVGDEDGVRRAAEEVRADHRRTLLQVFATTEGVKA